MNRFKVFLRSGTVISVVADQSWNNDNGFLFFVREGVNIATFAPGMWEGFQDLRVIEPKRADVSGS